LLVRPWLLAALAGDPQYLSHLVVTVLVTAGVIWPTLRRHQVSTTRRTATHASLRLLYSTATLISAHTPGGMFWKYFVSVLAHGGRWKLSAGLAWCHGLLLQVGWPHPPPMPPYALLYASGKGFLQECCQLMA
jgi:hypothetical protein